jgi:tRNA(fMet)-specific endonuclease VapC
MTYLLDTNAWIQYLNKGEHPIKRRVSAVDPARIRLCSIVKAELYLGAEKSNRTNENLQTLDSLFVNLMSFDFDDQAAREYGRLRAQLEREGTPIGPNDLMIAAIALANRSTLVTHNTAEFSRIKTLQIEDWE